MQHERRPPDDPREWHNRARSNLVRAQTTLPGHGGETIPQAIADATDLTRFAVATRYPSVAEPVTTEEHHRAVAIAEAVVTWADERVGEGSSLTRQGASNHCAITLMCRSR